MPATNTQPSPLSGRLPYLTIAISLTALVLFGLGENAQRALQYDAAGIQAGEWWRLATQHLVHWNGSQLGWDVAAFLGLGVLCERLERQRFTACLVASAPVLSLALLIGQPGLATCRGISGIDSALFALLIWQVPRAPRGRAQLPGLLKRYALPLTASSLFVAKCGYEYLSGSALFADTADSAFTVVPLVHLVGFVCGMAAACAPGRTMATPEPPAIPCRA